MESNVKSPQTNEHYLEELQEGKIQTTNFLPTPYANLLILLDTRDEDYSYKDEDGDRIHSTNTVVDRKALIKQEDGKYAFLIDNWFDEIDNFTMGLYAKVRLGRFCNLITPIGEYLFPNWFGEIEFHGNNLIYCYAPSKAIAPYYYTAIGKNQPKPERVCSIYDKRGQILMEDVIVKSPFINGESVISKNGLFNYINEDGLLLREEWLSDAKAFDKTGNGIFAFVKTERGWGVIDHKGGFVYSPRFSSIRKAEWDTSRDYYSPLAIVEDDEGQNLLMSKYDQSGESQTLILGFRNSVDAVALVGDASRILAKQGGEWSLYVWNDDKHQYDFSIELGELDKVEDTLWQVQGKYYRLIQKGDMFNVVGTRGPIFNEWYSEVLLYGNLFKVKRILDTARDNTEENGGEESPLYEFNLISLDGTYKLKEWTRIMTVTPFGGAFLVNIKPKLTKGFNGCLFDSSFTQEKIQGSCNIIMGDLLFNTWHDGIEFLNGHIFTDGYLKVWNDGKCNLIDERGEYVSPEWMDDFLTSDWKHDSYLSDLKGGAFEVKKDNKKNLIYKGKLVFDQWFSEIKRHHEHRFSDTQSRLEAYDVQVGYKHGIYYLNSGLFGGRLYDSISRISDTLYFSIFDDLGHIMSLDGKVLTTAPMFKVHQFKNGYAVVTNDRRGNAEKFQYNFINSDGQIVSPVWFDGNRYMRFNYSNDEKSSYFKVCKDSKYNLITPDKKLVFKKWYDSISGNDGKWLISDESRGELKFNFIDNDENLLSDEWFKDARPLRNLDEGVYAVESELGYNVFNNDNEFTLPKWTEGRVYEDDSSRLAVVVERSGCNNHYYYLNKRGHLITPYWSYEDSVKRYYRQDSDNYEELLILDIHEDDSFGGYMQILCKSDGTPFFKEDEYRPLTIQHSQENLFSRSIFGSIEEYSVPDMGSFLIVNKHWPIKNDDNGQYVIINYEGKELTDAFESIGNFDEDGYAVVKRHGLYNLINKDFRLLSSLWFTSLGYEYKSKETEYSDYMDYETGMVESSPYQVERIRRNTSFHDGCLKVELAGSFNLMNEAGRIQFPVWYDSLIILSFGYYKVGLNGLFNIVNVANQPISDVWFDKMGICKKDYEKIIYGGQKGDRHRLLFIQESSAILSDDWFDKVARYDKSDGYYSVRLNGKKNFVTDDGKLLVPGWHEDQLLFRDYCDVYVVVKDDEKFNIYSSRQSKFLSENGFDKVIRSGNGLFNYGWCGVQVDGKYTFVNEEGVLAEGRFDSIHDFRYGFAGVVIDGKKNYLTSEGTLLSDVWFEEISAFASCRKAIVRLNSKLNIIDSTGALLLSGDIQDVTSIESIGPDYCLLSFKSEDGKTTQKYYDFKTAHLHESDWEVKEYLDGLKADAAKENNDSTVERTDSDNVDANPAIDKRIKQIRQLIETNGKAGINYTMISFGDKSNLVDKTGTLVFEEWVDSSSIQMIQGVPIMMKADNKWIIVK